VPGMPLGGTEPQVSEAGTTVNVPLQLAVFVTEPQLAVALILLCVPGAGSLQLGEFSQVMPVGVSPLLQVKAGRAIAVPSYPEAGTALQVSVTGVALEELENSEEELLLTPPLELLPKPSLELLPKPSLELLLTPSLELLPKPSLELLLTPSLELLLTPPLELLLTPPLELLLTPPLELLLT